MSSSGRYCSYASYLKATGKPQLHVVPLDLGLGCPNRDTDGTGGCTFCPADGARARQIEGAETVEQQVKSAIEFAKRRYGAKRFMAYVQAFTGTFAAASQQRELYDHILGLFPFSALSIGTRPDCLPTDTIDFLQDMAKHLEVRVELGIQTANDNTLKRISRGHDWHCSIEAIEMLDAAGIPVIAHAILGLPGETQDDFNHTAEKLAKLPLAGLKIHNLHIVKGTELARDYENKPFPVMNEFEYLEALMGFLRRLPADLPILRVTTDSPEDQLVAPNWHLSKGQFVELLERHLAFRLWKQGDLVGGEPQSFDMVQAGTSVPNENEPVETGDGSITFWSPIFKEHYHTTAGARGESVGKYVQPSRLRDRLATGPVRLLDVCFGLGYNTLSAIDVAREVGKHPLSVTALEIDRGVVRDAAHNEVDPTTKELLQALFNTACYDDGHVSVEMTWGDARHTTAAIDGPYDVVYLDAFSTQRNSELWTVEFFDTLYGLMADDAVLLTYCAALPVRSGLMTAGFHVGNTQPFGRERPGTIATKQASLIDCPMEAQELQNIETTTKGIPFRDPSGVATNREILKSREERVREFKENAKC